MSRGYHHGGLRETLVDTCLGLIAERGFEAFSVAEAARRAGVSAAAPYRHFADRASLLAAVAGTVARRLAERVDAAAAGHANAAERLAAATGAYTGFVIESRAGLHVIFAPGLDDPRHAGLHEHSRALMDRFLALAFAVSPGPETGLDLMERLLAQAHGYATFHLDGVFAQHGHTAELVVHKSETAARTLIGAWQE
ncbi:TetR family transcriptional regulator [Amycolatopsis antarctica]|uniref:TetR family transcriptional regulator n=1 Tax=Amycolatopsis antarctica TaxID=1854586 RepID=A0A263CX98_9PSEU|nr:TetR/AcrR family transcriptional regulator [Amycolatopsis antarctica]OZM69966.1 TetR family transcriptional regulator [Amycolatopsis antarctica]